jgi:hypothetical protein
MRAAGDLGVDVRLTVERGARQLADGDRIMFLQNERGLGVKNGTLGTVEQVSAQSMTVQTDDGRSVQFNLKDYNKIDYGYAATIHKAQGMTVERCQPMPIRAAALSTIRMKLVHAADPLRGPTPRKRRRSRNSWELKSYAALRSCRQTNARARNHLLIEGPDSSGTAFGPA